MNAIITAKVYSLCWGCSIHLALTEWINADNSFGGPVRTHISTAGPEALWFTAASFVVTRFGKFCSCLAAIYHWTKASSLQCYELLLKEKSLKMCSLLPDHVSSVSHRITTVLVPHSGFGTLKKEKTPTGLKLQKETLYAPLIYIHVIFRPPIPCLLTTQTSVKNK